jgi:hypothetical protein
VAVARAVGPSAAKLVAALAVPGSVEAPPPFTVVTAAAVEVIEHVTTGWAYAVPIVTMMPSTSMGINSRLNVICFLSLLNSFPHESKKFALSFVQTETQ